MKVHIKRDRTVVLSGITTTQLQSILTGNINYQLEQLHPTSLKLSRSIEDALYAAQLKRIKKHRKTVEEIKWENKGISLEGLK